MSFKPTQLGTNATSFNNPKSNLNPNATEFIPLFPTATATATATLSAPGAVESSISPPHHLLANAVSDLDRPKSSVSNNSDEEARQYWSCQLPDDITPDFNDEELNGIANISLDALSLDEGVEALRITSSPNTSFLVDKPRDTSFISSLATPVSFGARLSSTSSLNVNAKAWEAPTSKASIFIDSNRNRPRPLSGNVGDFMDGILSETPGMVGSNEPDPLAFLADQFTGFSYESLTEVFVSNQQNLNSTVKMLTQLEHQVEGCSTKVANSKSSSLNPNAPVFLSRAAHETQNSMIISSRDGLRQSIEPYKPSERDTRGLFSPTFSNPIRPQGSVDLNSGIGNSSLQKSYLWNYKRNGSIDLGIGSSKRSDRLAPPITSVPSFQRRVSSPTSANRISLWRGYGQAVAMGNVHPELGEDFLQHGRTLKLNTYLQQACPTYSMVNKSPAKESEVPSYSMVVKPVHLESINNQSNTRREERLIDVHDLHVTDAIHVLSHELNTIRSAARASEQSLPVCICVGSENHHTREAFTHARLPAAIRRYLLEEERLNYSEFQPGLLRVVIC